jgi:hypothetical protein
MMRIADAVLVLAVAGGLSLIVACEKKPAPAPQPSGGAKAGDSHAGHDHAHGDEHSDEGPKVELGEVKAGAFTLRVARSGAVAAGKEVVITVSPVGTAPATIRAWIGYEDAKGATKAKLEKESEGYHGHLDAPSPLPTDVKLWIETEDAAGVRATGSVSLGG